MAQTQSHLLLARCPCIESVLHKINTVKTSCVIGWTISKMATFVIFFIILFFSTVTSLWGPQDKTEVSKTDAVTKGTRPASYPSPFKITLWNFVKLSYNTQHCRNFKILGEIRRGPKTAIFCISGALNFVLFGKFQSLEIQKI